MKLPKCLGLAVVLALVTLVVLKIEIQITNPPENFENRLGKAYQIVKEMRYKATLDFQLQSWFGKFREDLNADSGKFFAGSTEPDYLRDNLPEHTLAIAKADRDGRMISFANLVGQTDGEMIRIFVDLAGQFKIEFSDHSLSDEKKADLEKCDELMRKFLGVPTAKINMIMLRASRFSIYNAMHDSTWFFWDKFLAHTGESIYVFSRIKMLGLAPNTAFVSYLKNADFPGYYCTYFNFRNNVFHAQKSLKTRLDQQEVRAIARECRKKLADKSDNEAETVGSLNLKRHLVIIGRKIGKEGLFPIVVIDKADRQQQAVAQQKLSAFVVICALLIFLVNWAAFGRGPELKVGSVLILTIILAILMPFMLGRSVFKLILTEAYEKERLKVERDLHQTLSGIDNSYKTAQVNMRQRMEEMFNKKEVVEKLLDEEKNDSGEIAHNSIMARVLDDVFLMISKGYEFIPVKYRAINAMIISGPDGFLRYFNKYRGYHIYTRHFVKDTEAMFLLITLFKSWLIDSLGKASFSAEYLQTILAELNNKGRAFKLEEAENRLKNSIGPNKYHDLKMTNSSVMGLRTSFGEGFFSNFPIRHNGKIRYYASGMWDEFAFCPTFLRGSFHRKRNADLAAAKEERFFSLLERKPMALMAYDGFRFDSFSTEDQEPEMLSNLVKSTYRSRLLLRHETGGEGASIFQVYPGQNISVYLIGAQQDITHLRKIEKLRSVLFFTGILLFMVFAVAAAKNLSDSFTSPLQHLLWGLRKVEGNDYSIRLKDAREDEFGSISRAFNVMTRRLKEKDILGRFVSNSVKKLAANPKLLKKAIEGDEEEVTVLFASLEGFGRLALEKDPAEVQKFLEFSLVRFFARTEQYGGEVDKVIGEKILIIFSHQKLGKENAALAAASLVKDICRDFSGEEFLKPVFGINMGRVISGIIGAADIKMDLTVIGDPVNVAARLCALARSEDMPVIISGQINENLSEKWQTEKIDIATVKGKRQEVEVFKLKI